MSQKEEQFARVKILEDNDVISPACAECTRRVIDLVSDKGYSDEALETFITHFAMAGERAFEGVEEEAYDREIIESLKDEEKYSDALSLRDDLLAGCRIPFSETEQEFLLVHILNLIS